MLRPRPTSLPTESVQVVIDALRGQIGDPWHVEHVGEDVLSYIAGRIEGKSVPLTAGPAVAMPPEHAAKILEDLAAGRHMAGSFDWKALFVAVATLLLKLLG